MADELCNVELCKHFNKKYGFHCGWTSFVKDCGMYKQWNAKPLDVKAVVTEAYEKLYKIGWYDEMKGRCINLNAVGSVYEKILKSFKERKSE